MIIIRYLLLQMLVVFSIVHAQNGWIRQNINTTSTLTDVFFITPNTGWCCGNDGIYKTTNGGMNWILKREGDANFESLFFLDNNIGWVVGSSGYILKTADGGDTWHSQQSNTSSQLSDVFFINNISGWAVCYEYVTPHILCTTDGGENWMDYANCLTAMHTYFVSEQTGFSCLQGISKTTDGGKTWIKKQNALSYGDFHGIFFIDKNIGWVAGVAVYKTIDGGETWEYKKKFGDYLNPPQSYQQVPVAIYFIDSQTGWACGYGGTIFTTNNGGDDWIQQDSGTEEMLRAIFFTDRQTGYAVGENGIVLKTETGGHVTEVENKNDPHLIPDFLLYQNYPNPFNPSTEISFDLPNSQVVKLTVYDIRGRNVSTVLNRYMERGYHSVTFNACSLPSGIYFYRIETTEYRDTKRMILLK